jgi:ubiquinone/menaquinone biosynthesis C-methylase UbiE
MFKTITMVKSKYNQTAKVYNDRYRDTQFDKYRIMLSGITLKGKILDHGCGTGLLSEFLGGDNFTGCDSSKEMLKIRGSGDLCNVEKLPYGNDSFDIVISFSVLMNCKKPEAALLEVKRVLKKDGTFVCTFLKHFGKKLKPLLQKHFKINLETDCGEDIGFVCKIPKL